MAVDAHTGWEDTIQQRTPSLPPPLRAGQSWGMAWEGAHPHSRAHHRLQVHDVQVGLRQVLLQQVVALWCEEHKRTTRE